MRELKPKLMIANSGRRRRSLGGGFWSFLTFLIVFLVGVYAGTKLDDFYVDGTEAPLVKKESPAEKPTAKYETTTEPIIDKDEIPPGGINASTDEASLLIDEKKISDELIAAGPVLSVNINNKEGLTDAGITSIDPVQISGETKTVEDTALAKPGNTAQDTAKTDMTQPEKTSKRGYTLQVGAYADKAQAEKVVSNYRSKGFSAYTVQVENTKGEKWNLVKIGKYGSIEQAWSQSSAFKRSVGKDAYVESLGTKTVFNESWGKNE
ncbi:MAG: SPOR domain-containing protein, partial [Thermodesulfobacteriota bacterium]